MNKILLTVTIIAISISSAVYANEITNKPALPFQTNRFVKDSYIVTFREPASTENPLILAPDRARNLNKPAPFGEHSTGQSKTELENTLGIKGQVVRIFEMINAAQIHMDSEEAYNLSLDKRVLRVEQEGIISNATTQTNPGWGLDRLNSSTAALDNNYSYTNNGAGQTIYILDSGLNVGSSSVNAEFGGRATIFYDFNAGGTGNDCLGHGTEVASAAAGNTFGVAKGATLNIVKVTSGCTSYSVAGSDIASFNWLAANAPAGTIVNWSRGYSAPYTLINNEPFLLVVHISILH